MGLKLKILTITRDSQFEGPRIKKKVQNEDCYQTVFQSPPSTFLKSPSEGVQSLSSEPIKAYLDNGVSIHDPAS